MLCHPCVLGGHQCQARGAKSEMVPSPLPRREAQKRAEMLSNPCRLGGPQRQARGAKAEVVISLLTCWQPKRGRKCYVTPASSGVPIAKRWKQNQEWLPHPCLHGGQKERGNAWPPLPPRGSPTPKAGTKIRSGYLTPAFSVGKKRAEMLCHPCILGGPQRHARGAK